MRQKAHGQEFRQNNNRREPHKTGGKIPHSIFRHAKRGGISYIQAQVPIHQMLHYQLLHQ